jgi:hypothetical protein
MIDDKAFCASCQRWVYGASHDDGRCPVCSLPLIGPDGDGVERTGSQAGVHVSFRTGEGAI